MALRRAALLFLPLGLAPLCMVLLWWQVAAVDREITAHLNRGLHHHFGPAVSLQGLSLRGLSTLTLRGVALGPVLSAPEVRVMVGRDPQASFGVRRIVLVQPQLSVRLPQDVGADIRRASDRHRPTPRTPPSSTSRKRRIGPIDVLDATVRIEGIVSGQPVVLQASGVSGTSLLTPPRDVGAAAPFRTWLARRVEISLAHRINLVLGAVGLLRDEKGYPVRLAILGGHAHALDEETRLNLISLQATRRDSQLVLHLHGAAPGRTLYGDSGTFALTLKAPSPRRLSASWLRVPDSFTLELSQLSLASLAKLLAPLGVYADETIADGQIALSRGTNGHEIDAQLTLSALTFNHRRLALRPIGPLNAQVVVQATLQRNPRTIDLRHVRLDSRALRLYLHGRLNAPSASDLAADLTFNLPETPCHALLSAIPAGMAPHLEGMSLAGRMGAQADLAIDTRALEDALLAVNLAPFTCRVRRDPPRADVTSLRIPFALVRSGAHGPTAAWLVGPENPFFRPLSAMPAHVPAAFVAAEDNRFYRHRGFDAHQLLRALRQNLVQARIVRGASTISQQVIKNVFLSSERTLARKLEETILTWRLEQELDKRRILEIYLNIIDLGSGTRGVARASQHYFGRAVSAISPLQAAHLAALAPSPGTYAAQIARGGVDAAWSERLESLLLLMMQNGDLNHAAYQRGRTDPLNLVPRKPPR